MWAIKRCAFVVAAISIAVTACTTKSEPETVTQEATSASTGTTAQPAGQIPALPSPLPEVRDPGTIDPVLGTFPVDQPRDVQYAWVTLAPKGRTYTGNLRQIAADPNTAASLYVLVDQPEDSIYLDGVLACVGLRENFDLDVLASQLGANYVDAYSLTDDEAKSVGDAIVFASANDLCPDMKFLIDDPQRKVPTPAAIKAILGVESLSDADANRFANYVCAELNRGTTKSRMVSDVADQFSYPDDLSESLVEYVEKFAC